MPTLARRGPKRKRPNWRRVKIHRPYTIDEVSKTTGLSKATIRRWIKDGTLPAIVDKRPFLILGVDIAELIKARSRRRSKLALHQCYCLKCRQPRSPALGMADYLPLTPTTGNLRALCEICATLMHKAIAARSLPLLVGVVEVTVMEAGEHLVDTRKPPLDDHFEGERETHG